MVMVQPYREGDAVAVEGDDRDVVAAVVYGVMVEEGSCCVEGDDDGSYPVCMV